ncbi:helix-turn-helix transcriptional regulator [Dickeya dadantii]|uniref:helix-turn-helix transcriptional regulator n=1 Tax=Dickeya dadantii TaxID=204038 RepID=UPI0005773863|nr:helix-turn-helix transcriptional regulator [Dickeya dadantii]
MASRESMGKTIASTRKACGLTQKQVAEQTGINKTTLSEIENGRFTGSLDIFERYLDAVGLQLELMTKQHRLPGWDEVDKLFAEDE